VLGAVVRVSAGLRFGLRMRDAVSVSLLSTFEKMRLLNVAVPAESAAELVPLADNALSVSVMVTRLVPGA